MDRVLFQFDLSAADAENLVSILNDAKVNAMVEAMNPEHSPEIRAWWTRQIAYLQGLYMAVVKGSRAAKEA